MPGPSNRPSLPPPSKLPSSTAKPKSPLPPQPPPQPLPPPLLLPEYQQKVIPALPAAIHVSRALATSSLLAILLSVLIVLALMRLCRQRRSLTQSRLMKPRMSPASCRRAPGYAAQNVSITEVMPDEGGAAALDAMTLDIGRFQKIWGTAAVVDTVYAGLCATKQLLRGVTPSKYHSTDVEQEKRPQKQLTTCPRLWCVLLFGFVVCAGILQPAGPRPPMPYG